MMFIKVLLGCITLMFAYWCVDTFAPLIPEWFTYLAFAYLLIGVPIQLMVRYFRK